MALKKRSIRAAKEGAGNTAPKPSGGIKKRTSVPLESDAPKFSGELGDMIQKITDSGAYGNPFIKASSRRMIRPRIRTGILAVDLGLGGGWAKSSCGMLYGEKSAGKSFTALQSIAAYHRKDQAGVAAWIDVEGTFDPAWARKIGCDLDRIIIIEPESGEHAVDLADQVLRTKEIGLVVLDSIAMIVPMKEIEESTEQDFMGLQSRLMGKYLRRGIQAIIKERGRGHMVNLININQWRMKIGIAFGDPRTLPGGKILEFATSQQIEVKNKEHKGKDADGNEVVFFNEHNFNVTKNKTGGPMKSGTFKLIRTAGHENLPEAWIDQAKTIANLGLQTGLITGTKGAFEIEGFGKFRGAGAYNAWAQENLESHDQVQELIIEGFRKKWDL
jgi:recombination protein RecA